MRELDSGELYSACMFYRHDFGLLSDPEKEVFSFQCAEWHKAIQKAISKDVESAGTITSKDIHPGEKWFIKLQGAGALVAREITSVSMHTVKLVGLESWERIGVRYKFSDLEFVERFG